MVLRVVPAEAGIYIFTARPEEWPATSHEAVPFDIRLKTYDNITKSKVDMYLPLHVTRCNLSKWSLDPKNMGPEYEFEGEVTFIGGITVTVRGTFNTHTGRGTFCEYTP